ARALVAAYLGQSDTAEQAIVKGLKLAEQLDDPATIALLLAVQGLLNLSRREADSADQNLSEASALMARIGLREPAWFTAGGDQIEAALAIGAVDRAAEMLARLRERAERTPYPWLSAIAARCRAQVSMVQGDLAGALASGECSCVAFQQLHAPFELARAQLVRGKVLRRLRQRR